MPTKKKAKKTPIKVKHSDTAGWVTVPSYLESRGLPSCLHLTSDIKLTIPNDLATHLNVRTITVVAENATWIDKDQRRKSYKMETGRMAAQVGHAISKLKMSYIIINAEAHKNHALDIAKTLEGTPI